MNSTPASINAFDDEYWRRLAFEHLDAQRPWAALVAFERARVLQPRDEPRDLRYALTLTEVGRLDEAHQVLAGIEAPSEELLFPYLAAWIQYSRARGDVEAEVSWSRRLVDEFPDQSDGYIYLGYSLARQGRSREAEHAFRTGAQRVGYPDEAYYNLAVTLNQQGRFAEAKDALERALAIDPDYEIAAALLEDVNCAAELLAQIQAINE